MVAFGGIKKPRRLDLCFLFHGLPGGLDDPIKRPIYHIHEIAETKEREMINAFLFSSPRKIVFEPNGIQKVGEELKALGAKKPLLVTDKGVKSSGLLAKLIGPLNATGITYSVFDEVEPNPSMEVVE